MIEFDLVAVLTESTIVRYFEEGLKLSIKAEIDQDASHLDDYKERVAKVVRAKAKAGLQLSSYIWETKQQVSQGNQSAHTTTHKDQTQREIKNYCKDKSKAKASVSTSTQDSKSFNKARKNKKKKKYKAKRDFTSAIKVNKVEFGNYKRKKKDVSEIMYYNCNKKNITQTSA